MQLISKINNAEGVRQFQPSGWSVATTLGHKINKNGVTLKALGNDALIPGFSLRSNPGLKLANAFGVFASYQVQNATLLPKLM